MPLEEVLVSIGSAALAGGLFGLVGYFKNKKQEEAFEGFDAKAFFVSVVGSAVVGGIASYMGVAPDVVSSGAIGIAVFQGLRKLAEAIFK